MVSFMRIQRCFRYSASWAVETKATYLASTVDRATIVCFLLLQLTSPRTHTSIQTWTFCHCLPNLHRKFHTAFQINLSGISWSYSLQPSDKWWICQVLRDIANCIHKKWVTTSPWKLTPPIYASVLLLVAHESGHTVWHYNISCVLRCMYDVCWMLSRVFLMTLCLQLQFISHSLLIRAWLDVHNNYILRQFHLYVVCGTSLGDVVGRLVRHKFIL